MRGISGTSSELARTITVAPVSTEMHCDYCHSDGQRDHIATGKVETNILTLHDKENADEYPAGFGRLMDHRPVLCATCHASNALGTTGKPGIPNLSKAMHSKHAGVDDEAAIWQQRERRQQPKTSATTAIRVPPPSACAT